MQFVDAGAVNTRDGNQSRSEALVDLNRDGKLDWVRSCQGQNFKVDFGDGKGKFTEDSALIPQPQGNALDAGVIFADLDADGDEDMIINWGGYNAPGGVDYGRVRVLINDGTMNLVEKTTELGLKTERLAILGAGDVDQDGDVDVIGLDDRKFPEVIYLNDGRGSFSALPNAVTGVTGSAQYAMWGLATVTDLDNDGIADILIDGRYFFHVLRGTGGGHFVFQNDAWGRITRTAEASVDGGFAFGDIDSDGDLDLMGFSATDPSRQVALYRNDLPAQRWLNIRPVGLSGNKAARELEDPHLRSRHRATCSGSKKCSSIPSKLSRTTTHSMPSSATMVSATGPASTSRSRSIPPAPSYERTVSPPTPRSSSVKTA